MLRLRGAAALFVCLILTCAGGFGQSAASFTTKTFTAAAATPRDVYTVDLNGDGFPDLIEVSNRNMVSLQMAYGTGNFSGPKTLYTFPTTYQGTAPMVYGDVNNDQNGDLVFALAGSNQLAVFLNKGAATFQAPKYETIALPGGQTFGGGPMIAGDFNGDGKLDLVTEGNTATTEALYLIPGDGAGNFGAPQTIYTLPASTGIGSLGIGDFDGDGHADVALSVNSQCTNGGCGQADLYVLYGNGAGAFTTTHVYNTTRLSFSTGDVNSDGRTDIFGIGGTSSKQLVVLTSQAGRQFTTFTMTANETLSGGADTAAPIVLADFNGDGAMDLATLGTTASSSEFVVFLANGSGGYQEQTVNIGAAQTLSNLVVGLYGYDSKPDLATIWSNASSSSTLTVAQNSTTSGSWGAGCFYHPTGWADYCGSGYASENDVHITASAGSFGLMRKVEAWVDGRKIGEQYNVWGGYGWLDLHTKLSVGNHTLALLGVDVDNRLVRGGMRYPLVVVACDAPGSPGINLCSPTDGSTVGEHVSVVAAVNPGGTLSAIELWVDGAKYGGDVKSSPLDEQLTLPAGTHRIAVVATNTAGEKWEKVANVTVPADLGCHAPSSPGVNLCIPTNGEKEEMSGQISEILATANVTGTFARMELWIDGKQSTVETGSTTMHFTRYPVGPLTGRHRVAVLAVNTAGQVWESVAYVSW